MYEQHFGLEKRPFSAKPTAADVFVGPQTALTMASLKRALQSQDAVVSVSGPAGSGKSTLVAKALEALSESHQSTRIGRMSLAGTDVLEFLLEQLGVEEPPKGPIRQFTALREQLQQLENDGRRVVIVIEDAVVTGAETIAELEALTAADAGDSGGASIVMMGDERLREFLGDPQLARLGQRIRQRHAIAPLSVAELRGYLMHTLRQAGGDFEKIFDAQSADVIHAISGGVPRIANTVTESAMEAAANAGEKSIAPSLVRDTARDELGFDVSEVDLPAAKPETDPVPAAAIEPERAADPEPVAVPVLDPEATPEPEAVIVFSDEPRDESFQDDGIPELIQDTLPDLEVLAPEIVEAEPMPEVHADAEPVPLGTFEPLPEPAVEVHDAPEAEAIPELAPEPLPELAPEPVLATEPTPEADPDPVPELSTVPAPEINPDPEIEAAPVPVAEPEPVLEAAPEPVPEPTPDPSLALEPEAEPSIESSGTDVPEWERDPTIAELRPDLDALEKAMAFAHGGDTGAAEANEPASSQPEPPSHSADVLEDSEEIPEITLDNAIKERIENHLIDEPGSVSPTDTGAAAVPADQGDTPAIKLPPRKNKKADAELERIAAELAKAKTIEDVDDKLAETLFGEQLNLVAAQVVANGPESQSANDEELQLFDTNTAAMAQAAGSPVVNGVATEEQAIEVSLETRERRGEGGLDLSASQRLKTVRALNADLHPSLREPGNGPIPGPDVPARDIPKPESIEDQINTSMTQTLKALNVTPPITERGGHNLADDDDDEKKSGFFSRFRRS